jgi:hypothetical protein
MSHLDYIGQPDWDGHIEYMKSKVRCVCCGKEEVRVPAYRGLKKNFARLYMLICTCYGGHGLRWGT